MTVAMEKLKVHHPKRFNHAALMPTVLVLLLFFTMACIKLTIAQSSHPGEPVVVISTATPTHTPAHTPAPTATEEIVPTLTPTPDDSLRIFDQFIADLKNDNPDQIVGLWVEDILALRVVYQPSGNPGFVSTEDEVATYFMYPWQKAGNHGLLAHNYLAGRYFFDVQVGDILTLVFGDGYYLDFEVTEIKEFQALQPDSPYSNFIDLVTGEQLTVSNVFIEVYMGEFHTTLQTCIANGAETEWGRHFTIAPPL